MLGEQSELRFRDTSKDTIKQHVVRCRKGSRTAERYEMTAGYIFYSILPGIENGEGIHIPKNRRTMGIPSKGYAQTSQKYTLRVT